MSASRIAIFASIVVVGIGAAPAATPHVGGTGLHAARGDDRGNARSEHPVVLEFLLRRAEHLDVSANQSIIPVLPPFNSTSPAQLYMEITNKHYPTH